MKIQSSAFEEGGEIPSVYTCDGDRFLSPPLSFIDIPPHTATLALIVDDPDVPKEIREDGTFTHWILFNIPPETRAIPEGDSAGASGANTRGEARYTGPCPPPEYHPRKHRYIFTLYALDSELPLAEGATKEQVEKAMAGRSITSATLIGTYERK